MRRKFNDFKSFPSTTSFYVLEYRPYTRHVPHGWYFRDVTEALSRTTYQPCLRSFEIAMGLNEDAENGRRYLPVPSFRIRHVVLILISEIREGPWKDSCGISLMTCLFHHPRCKCMLIELYLDASDQLA